MNTCFFRFVQRLDAEKFMIKICDFLCKGSTLRFFVQRLDFRFVQRLDAEKFMIIIAGATSTAKSQSAALKARNILSKQVTLAKFVVKTLLKYFQFRAICHTNSKPYLMFLLVFSGKSVIGSESNLGKPSTNFCLTAENCGVRMNINTILQKDSKIITGKYRTAVNWLLALTSGTNLTETRLAALKKPALCSCSRCHVMPLSMVYCKSTLASPVKCELFRKLTWQLGRGGEAPIWITYCTYLVMNWRPY